MHDHPLLSRPETVLKSWNTVDSGKTSNNNAPGTSSMGEAVKYRIDLNVNLSTIVRSKSSHPELHGKDPQITHQFFVTKKTGANLTGGHDFKDATVTREPKRNMFGEFLSLSPGFGFHGRLGQDDFVDDRPSTVCLKNESSAETDAMESDVSQKIHLSSMCSSEESNKRVHANTELPDMNELPAFSAVADSIDDGGISTLKTQSLDVPHLVYLAKQPSTSAACRDVLGPEPIRRCVKRLKSSISEPTVDGNQARPEPARDQTAMLLKNGNPSGDLTRKNREFSLSKSWIHRWCRRRNESPNTKPEALVLCEPQTSTATFDELEKKQFPSIAAMALMGKAMDGFHPCEFRRKGSSIVWGRP
ncbi:Endoplasmatic reticulum retrieval protein 1B isoform 1 [Hibiscus syriacus]|uniref:Endoplasmatic reticulum retrieval protein 1B isoform 1 n=1 Tax=Hibiscus syriacus TaxID=106335 RepID=A0A6A2XMF0_HIBSY|nr:F-box protein At2g16365-like [Hibiscus syriacus]KAE8668145.1 Endoplasmatic reticulum retrieval protein 1B isoform 1 [Hibiscus syriacus]